MGKLVLLPITVMVVVCICCGGLLAYTLVSIGKPDKTSLPTEPVESIEVSTARVVPTTTPTPPPPAPATSSPTPISKPLESDTGGNTFLPYQSSTISETAACISNMAKVQTASPLAAQVIRVIDGDTIDVSIDGVEQRVRYIGIDSPEMDFPLGSQAQAENAKLVEGQEVLLIQDISDKDRYQRLLRYVIANKVFVNEALVRTGFAMSKGYMPDTACQELFDQAEVEAKAAGLGLWAPTPIPSPGSATLDNPSAGLVIQHIFFDGLVRRVESDEYAEIANTGATAVDLTGWRLNAGNPGQDFVFPDYMIGAGQTCRIYTNQTHAESGGFSFASKDPIWNNQGDCGYLYDPQGNLIDDYCY